jgi:phosphatidylglycerol:prolipoprotein diacylglycerol transferase
MIHNIDPVIISLGPLAIRWYGLIFMAGFVLTYFFLNYVVKKNRLQGLTRKSIDDFIFYSVIAIVLGTRLFEVLFYEPGYYFKNPGKILAIWEGGLSFHGGLAGIILVTWLFTRKIKIPFKKMADVLSICGAFALFLGRIANFINGELYGFAVSNQVTPPWYAVKFIRTDQQQLWRVPTQLLESLKNLITFLVLFIIWKKAKNYKDGLLMWLFLIMYGTFRFVIEYSKDVYQNQFLGLSSGQLLCIPMILAGIIGLIHMYKKGITLKK